MPRPDSFHCAVVLLIAAIACRQPGRDGLRRRQQPQPGDPGRQPAVPLPHDSGGDQPGDRRRRGPRCRGHLLRDDRHEEPRQRHRRGGRAEHHRRQWSTQQRGDVQRGSVQPASRRVHDT